MRDYGELVKALREDAKWAEKIGATRTAKRQSDAADAIEELQAQVPHWISVEERLPEQFICVFATDGEDVGVAAFQGFIDDYPVWSNAWNLEYIEDQYDEDFLQVTHWMPLPEPPKGVE